MSVPAPRDVRRTGASVPADVRPRRQPDGAAARRRRPRHRRCRGQAHHHDAAAPQRHDPRGERDRRARGDEPVRGESEVADLPAADDVAVGDDDRARAISSIRRRRSPTTGTRGFEHVVCEEKHMGSRAVVVICRDEDVARRRFGVVGTRAPASSTPGPAVASSTTAIGARSARACSGDAMERVGRAGTRLATDWVVLDCELMPWSAKAQELIRQQYAAVGAAAGARRCLTCDRRRWARRGAWCSTSADSLERVATRRRSSERYVDAYRRYCWPVASVRDLRLAPFHVMATRGCGARGQGPSRGTWSRSRARSARPMTPRCCSDDVVAVVDLADPASEAAATAWWEEMTGARRRGDGGEAAAVRGARAARRSCSRR